MCPSSVKYHFKSTSAPFGIPDIERDILESGESCSDRQAEAEVCLRIPGFVLPVKWIEDERFVFIADPRTEVCHADSGQRLGTACAQDDPLRVFKSVGDGVV